MPGPLRGGALASGRSGAGSQRTAADDRGGADQAELRAARLLRGQRNIGDFRRWKEHDAYGKALERLLRDLKVEAS
jgi:hypothetical protein